MLALPAAVIAGWHVVSRRGLARVIAGVVVLVAVVTPVLHVLAHRPAALLVTMLLFGASIHPGHVLAGQRGVQQRGDRLRHQPPFRPGATSAQAGASAATAGGRPSTPGSGLFAATGPRVSRCWPSTTLRHGGAVVADPRTTHPPNPLPADPVTGAGSLTSSGRQQAQDVGHQQVPG